MKNTIRGFLGIIAVCALIVFIVFGLLSAIIDIDFISNISYIAGAVLALSIFGLTASFVLTFDWSEAPFLKATAASIIMGILSFVIYELFVWELFYTLFVICAVVAALAIVIGLIKTIFG